MLMRHLRFFVALAREKHFARAAAACNVTQPTLSAAIRKLEEELQATLVVRGHSFVGLTPEGQKVLDWGRLILSDFASLRDDLAAGTGGVSGTLRLGVVPAAVPALPILTARFAAAHPSAKIDVRTLSSRAIEQALADFGIDGAVTYLDAEPIENVVAVPLYRERYVFATHLGHPLARQSEISWVEALRQPLCLLRPDMQNRRIIDRIAAGLGMRVEPGLVNDSLFGLWTHLAQGAWSSIVPHTLAASFGRGMGVATVPLVAPDHSESVGLVVADRDPSGPMAHALLSVARGLDFGEGSVPDDSFPADRA